MIFNPQNLKLTEGSFIFSGDVKALAHPCLGKDIIKVFWHNFTFSASDLNVTDAGDYIFSVGNVKPLPLDGCDYSINIEQGGICVFAENEKDLIYGFMTLLDRFKAIDHDEKLAIEVECCQIKEKPLIGNRMVHFCIFPETELWALQRFIRFCGALKYTHVVLEFWGTLKYDCLRELSWSNAFTKDQIKPIINEAKDLGMEIIPMFNHWGHASASRGRHGKHVVLDQNPALQTYFSEDGWCWDIKKSKVRALMRSIRGELMDLCGDGKYFHIGCDEACSYEFSKENTELVCDYINEISAELSAIGRRAIVWGDMFLYRYPHYNPKNRYDCNAPSPEAEKYILDHLSKEVLIADWQYEAAEAPVETSAVFQKAGFDCLLCPWDRGPRQMNSVLSTAKEQNLMGYMHTTWHTLSNGMKFVTMAAMCGFEDVEIKSNTITLLTFNSAALLRKVMPIEGDYEKAGWSKIQVSDLW